MPNSRRRKFSIQNDISGKNARKMRNDSQLSYNTIDSDIKIMKQDSIRQSNSKSKIYPNISTNSSYLEVVTEYNESSSSVLTAKTNYTTEKDVTASSSNIDLHNTPNKTDNVLSSQLNNDAIEKQINDTRQNNNRERTPSRRDKYPHQHRIKVRSPKRRIGILEQNKTTKSNKHNIGTFAINWNQEAEIYRLEIGVDVTAHEDNERTSTHSIDDMCRICHSGHSSSELGRLISACSCRGTVGRVHVKCLERWLTESGKSRCELCGTRYETKRVHRYGVPRALILWILSQNAKQLMVDSLGITLMSPLAVLAAWLSGRTLAGLMTQDNRITPWPLASTFVLACMTLVCYYCWIVSAATRHALGWWIWYRSQYEVRLQLQDDADVLE